MEKKTVSEQEYADLIVVAYQECLNDPAIRSKLEGLITFLLSHRYRIDDEMSTADLIALALGELGYNEKDTNDNVYDTKFSVRGHKNRTKYANDMDKIDSFYIMKYKDLDSAAWCDIFVDWLFVKTFGVDRARDLTCQYEGRLRGSRTVMSQAYYSSTEKKDFGVNDEYGFVIGDQIFFGSGKVSNHTGIVCAVDYYNGYVYVIEGNSLPIAGKVVYEGRGVYLKRYSFDDPKIVGYKHPPFVEDEFMDTATRTRLNKTVIELYESIQAKLQDKCKDYPDVESVPPTRENLLQSVNRLGKDKVNLLREEAARKFKGVVNNGKK